MNLGINFDLQERRDKQTQPDLSEDFRQQIEGDAGIVYKLQVQLKTDVTDDECCDADWNAQEVGAASGNLKSKILIFFRLLVAHFVDLGGVLVAMDRFHVN